MTLTARSIGTAQWTACWFRTCVVITCRTRVVPQLLTPTIHTNRYVVKTSKNCSFLYGLSVCVWQIASNSRIGVFKKKHVKLNCFFYIILTAIKNTLVMSVSLWLLYAMFRFVMATSIFFPSIQVELNVCRLIIALSLWLKYLNLSFCWLFAVVEGT